MEKITQKKFKELIKNGYNFNYGQLNKDVNGYLSDLAKEKIKKVLSNSNNVNLCYSATNIKLYSKHYTYIKDNKDLVTSEFTNTHYYTFKDFIIIDFKFFRTIVIIKAVKNV